MFIITIVNAFGAIVHSTEKQDEAETLFNQAISTQSTVYCHTYDTNKGWFRNRYTKPDYQ